jgi:putative transposase
VKFNELKLGSTLDYYGRKYTIIEIDPPNIVMKRIEGDGESICVDYFQLISDPAFHVGKHLLKRIDNNISKYRSILDILPEEKREKVSERLNTIRPIIVLEKAKSDITYAYEFVEQYNDLLEENENLYKLTQFKLLERISLKSGISTRTIKRYLSSYKEAEHEYQQHGEEGLITKAGMGYIYRKDNKQLEIRHPKRPEIILDVLDLRIDEIYIPIIKNVIENQYLLVKKITKKATYDYIKINCTAKNIEPPKEITIYKLLDRIDEQVKAKMRDGKIGEEKFRAVDRGFSDEEALYPLHIVEIDHTELDIDVLDDRSFYNLGRPWITLGIDVFSRMVWCMYISFEPPSANRVRKTLQHGLFMKKSKERFNTRNEWCIHGIPSTIMLDNGPEFKSVEVKRMINETMHSNVRYRPVKTPRYGGTIERLFGTINSKLIHRLDGTRKSSPKDLGDYDPDKEAALTLSNLEEILTRYITDIYHYEVHKGLPLDSDRPIVRYFDGLKKVGLPEFIAEEDEKFYRIELLPTTMKPYTRDGIRLDNRMYSSAELSYLISDRNTKYKIKYDIDDISYIYLLPPGSDEYIKVYASYPSADSLEGMNSYTYNLIRRKKKEEGKLKANMIPGTKLLEEGKVDLQTDINKMYKKNRRVRQKVNRMNIDIIDMNATLNKGKEVKPTIDDLFNAAQLAFEKRKEIDNNEQGR